MKRHKQGTIREMMSDRVVGRGAAVGVSIDTDFPAAIREMTRMRHTFELDPKIHARYDELYNQVYKKWYNRLKPLYETMRQVWDMPDGVYPFRDSRGISLRPVRPFIADEMASEIQVLALWN